MAMNTSVFRAREAISCLLFIVCLPWSAIDPDSEGGRRILLEVCGSFGSGNEYTTIILNKTGYDMFGTFSPWRLPKDEFKRLLKKNEAEMNSRKQDE